MKIPDVTSWDWVFSEVEKFCTRNNVYEDKKRIIVEGYKEMREVLGEDFLKKSSNSMIPSLYNFAPWSLQKNADFGQKLKMLKGRKIFEDVKRDLLQDNFENSFGAEAVVEVAGDLIKKGLKVELVGCAKGKRTPDFRVKVGNEWIYFEVTTFRTYSNEIKNIHDFWSKLVRGIDQICRIHDRFIEVDFNSMTIREAENRFNTIIEKASEIVQSLEESEVIINGVRLSILKGEEGYGSPYIHGIKLITDEMHAIFRKLSEKIKKKQLPSGKCGVLLIFTRSPFPPDFKFFIPSMAERLLEFISTEPNLYAGVVQYICHEQLDFSVNNDIFKITLRTEHDGIYNCYTIIIPNPNFKIEEGMPDFLVNVL